MGNGKQLLLVAGWTALALGLRLYQLDLKPLWTDEISTLAFSLGHGFKAVPLSQMLTAEALLQPLQIDATKTAGDASSSILAYSNHPPLFFALMHSWLQLTHADGSAVVPAVARSLSALIGALLTPLIYGLVFLTLRSPVTAQFAAALTALSPFGLYLSQEARHYTLALVWITASLYCLTEALRRMEQGRPLPFWLVLVWIGVNGLGLATHYFMAIALLAQVLVLVGAAYLWRRPDGVLPRAAAGLGLVALGTAVSGIPWIFALVAAPDQGQLTQWIQSSWSGADWIAPVTHTVASAVSMVYLLPIQGVPGWVAILSAVLAIAIAVWSVGGSLGGLVPWRSRPAVGQFASLWGTCAASIAILWAISYGQQVGLAQVLRYHFVYFPAFVGVMAVGLAQRWRSPQRYSRIGVGVALLISLAGSVSVAQNLAYQKVHRPDLVGADIVEEVAETQRPAVAAASHQSHGQTGRLMAIAWDIKTHRPELLDQFRFFLDPQPCAKTGEQNCGAPGAALLESLPEGEDLWLINYAGQPGLRRYGCRYHKTERVDGYKYQHYRC